MIKYLETETFGKLPIRIQYSALKKFEEATGKSLMMDPEVLKNMQMKELEVLLFYSIKSGYRAINEECKLTQEQMEDILDEDGGVFYQFLTSIPDFMQKMLPKNVKTLPKKANPAK